MPTQDGRPPALPHTDPFPSSRSRCPVVGAGGYIPRESLAERDMYQNSPGTAPSHKARLPARIFRLAVGGCAVFDTSTPHNPQRPMPRLPLPADTLTQARLQVVGPWLGPPGKWARLSVRRSIPLPFPCWAGCSGSTRRGIVPPIDISRPVHRQVDSAIHLSRHCPLFITSTPFLFVLYTL